MDLSKSSVIMEVVRDSKEKSSDVRVKEVKVKDVVATLDSETGKYNVKLPAQTVLSELTAKDIVVTLPEGSKAKVAAATTTEEGKNWTVVVTAEDEKITATYTINVTLAKANDANITFVKLENEGKVYESKEILNGILYGKNLTNENVKIQLLKNDEEIKTKINIKNVTDKKLDFSIELPDNNTFNNEKYTLKFANKDNTNSEIKEIEIEPSKNNTEMYVEELNLVVNKLSGKGTTSPITVKGHNLDSEKIELKLFKNGNHVDSKIDLAEKDESAIKYFLNIPENTTDQYIDYKLELKYGDKVISKEFTQLPRKIDADKFGIQAKYVVIDENLKKIVVEFDKEIMASSDDIKGYIGISTSSNNFQKLNEKDNIEIKGNELIITLDNSFDDLRGKSIKIREGAFKTEDGKYSSEFMSFISKDDKPHYESLTLDKDILTSQGGQVIATLKGRNLKGGEFGTLANIKESNSNSKSDIKCEVKGEGEKQTITFNLPENTTERSKSYILRVSFDNGLTYVDQTIYSNKRSDVSTITVLPKNKNENDTTLSYMTIRSYGPNIGGKLTETSCSINQESKKTQIGLYGTNLKKWTTKFKLVDEKGVEWPILTNPGHDSSDFPTMVLDWNGVIGEGNYQFVEIILPNNIDKEPEFTYYVAVDGENFDEDITVKAKVPTGLDGVANRSRDKIVDLTIKCVDEKGTELSTDSKKGYYWFMYNLLTKEELDSKIGGTLGEKLGDELEIPEIDGYEYDPKATNQGDLKGEYGAEGKVVTLVYKESVK